MKRYGSMGKVAAGIMVLASLSACKDDTTTGNDDNDTGTPSIGVSVSVPSVSIAQGGAGSVGVTVSRAGGYAGEISLAVEGLPSGVTGNPSPTPVPAGSTSATIGLDVGAGVAAGSHTITVRATGSGVSAKTATFTLAITAVTPQGGFTLALNPAAISLPQGSNAGVTVNITRTGSFTGTVALSVSGANPGITTLFDPAAVSGNSSALTVTASASATPGTYSLTVTGTANGASDQTTTLSVTITAAPPAGSVIWAFCAATGVPNWVAYKDGSNAWTKATPTGNTYSFDLPSGTGGLALVTTAGPDVDVRIIYGTTDELRTQGAAQCPGSGLLENYTGSVAGAAATDQAWISMGGATTVVLPTVNPLFALNDVPDGQRDLVASLIRQEFSGGLPTYSLNRLIIRRNLDPAAGAVLPALDFGSTEAFAPLTSNVTVSNIATDAALTFMSYHTATGTSAPFFNDISPTTATTRQYPGVPAAQQTTGDLHLLTILATPPGQQTPTETRSATIMFKEAVDKAIPLGPSMGAVTVSVAAAAPYVQPNLQTPIQPEYNKYFIATYHQEAGGVVRDVSIVASAGYIGSTASTFDITMPDFSTVPDWGGTWGFLARNSIFWTFNAMGWDSQGGINESPFSEGASARAASRSGELRS